MRTPTTAITAAVTRAWDRVSLPLAIIGTPVLFGVAMYAQITGAA